MNIDAVKKKFHIDLHQIRRAVETKENNAGRGSRLTLAVIMAVSAAIGFLLAMLFGGLE